MAGELERSPGVKALTLLEWLQERYPGEYPDKLLRTLQLRVKDWRAPFGPDSRRSCSWWASIFGATHRVDLLFSDPLRRIREGSS